MNFIIFYDDTYTGWNANYLEEALNNFIKVNPECNITAIIKIEQRNIK